VIPAIGRTGAQSRAARCGDHCRDVAAAHRDGGGYRCYRRDVALPDPCARADVVSRTLAVDLLNQQPPVDFLPVQGARGLGLSPRPHRPVAPSGDARRRAALGLAAAAECAARRCRIGLSAHPIWVYPNRHLKSAQVGQARLAMRAIPIIAPAARS